MEAITLADVNRAPPGINLSVAHPARVYDYWLGGKDNFPADREVGDRVLAIVPEILQSVRANRAFLKRAVRLAAEAGIGQFLDVGSGLPTAENTHEIAKRVAHDAHVGYVDNDPVVATHGRALLADSGSTTVVQADVSEPEAILGHPEVRGLIDFDQPVAVLMLGVLHLVADEQDPFGIVARFREVMAPGSFLIFSHLTADSDPKRASEYLAIINRSSGDARAFMRGRDQVERFFDGFELLDPGVVPPDRWRPETPGAMKHFWLWAGVGVRR